VPALGDLPLGCRFAGRCDVELPHCARLRPEESALGRGRAAACHLLGRVPA
jgi:peptide/nickel transport system ATP-binding protein